MAKYSYNGIYTYVRNAVKAEFPDVYVCGAEEPIPPVGLAVEILEVDVRTPSRFVTLDGQDEQWRVAFDVNVYSNKFEGAKTEAHDVLRVCEKAFRRLFFLEDSRLTLKRENNRVVRLAARFSRTIGIDDEMPEETPKGSIYEMYLLRARES